MKSKETITTSGIKTIYLECYECKEIQKKEKNEYV
jgi:hypothetical protein